MGADILARTFPRASYTHPAEVQVGAFVAQSIRRNWQPEQSGSTRAVAARCFFVTGKKRWGDLNVRRQSAWTIGASGPTFKKSPVRSTKVNVEQLAVSGGGGGDSGGKEGGGGDGDDGGEGDGGGEDSEKNKAEALAALAALKKGLDSLPKDLALAVSSGRIPGAVIGRFFSLESSPLLSFLLRFQGFKERLLADDLFFVKVGIECGVGLFTKTAAEYQKRREKFFKELDFVTADVIMALIADFMLVWLPAPTVSLSPAVAAGSISSIARFFASCPDNAFQVPIRGTSYNLTQRLGAIVRNGGKLLVVGTIASLIGTAVTNALKALRRRESLVSSVASADGSSAASPHSDEGPRVPVFATSVAYGVYMAVSSNLRYQILAGVVEQRILEPLLEDRKLALSLLSFIARTGNTFLGSLLWVDYARWVGVQSHD